MLAEGVSRLHSIQGCFEYIDTANFCLVNTLTFLSHTKVVSHVQSVSEHM